METDQLEREAKVAKARVDFLKANVMKLSKESSRKPLPLIRDNAHLDVTLKSDATLKSDVTLKHDVTVKHVYVKEITSIELVAIQYEDILRELHVVGPDATIDDYKQLDVSLLPVTIDGAGVPSSEKAALEDDPEALFPSSHGEYPTR
nr:hypothetical protein BaRGS_031711 [Batillaria attramentaria]